MMAKRTAHMLVDASNIYPSDMKVSISFTGKQCLEPTAAIIVKSPSNTRSQPRTRRTTVRIDIKKGPDVLRSISINLGFRDLHVKQRRILPVSKIRYSPKQASRSTLKTVL